ncbi:hypothetical protein GQ53DRAFT_544739 [Thozetella sp. PMI_491]|nr:hypothetical protein GQ53DRAFT_544739 [Thozetella sp. PMI_491]
MLVGLVACISAWDSRCRGPACRRMCLLPASSGPRLHFFACHIVPGISETSITATNAFSAFLPPSYPSPRLSSQFLGGVLTDQAEGVLAWAAHLATLPQQLSARPSLDV